ncbi:Gfo/Idh/MocA family protein [Nonomuraea dietziae]|uniref:Gfo/Idh/MocA family protein n=1 Tax=Nonomuraea dietziae TaxID=65515 RepID=UPI00340B42B3
MIRVGVVGASGWAGASHLPALSGLAEFEVTAVATTNQASADRAAADHGVRHAFADAGRLAAHPDVDLVVVSVKVPEHAKVIRAALDAGKHVLSEWPLGVNADEARELTEAATAAGVVHAVCLQGYHSPGARFVGDLLAEGRIGALESAVMVAAGDPLGGATIRPELAWSTDPALGQSVLTIMAGHFLATLDRVAGRLTEVSARLPRLHDQVLVAGTGRSVPSGVPSHVLLHGLLESGAHASVTVHGGDRAVPDGFLLKFVGAKGTLTVTPVQPGMFMHWADWEITLDGAPLAVPERYRPAPPGIPSGPAASVAAVYLEIARAVSEGRPPHPGFDTALRLHRLLATIERSASTGLSQEIS